MSSKTLPACLSTGIFLFEILHTPTAIGQTTPQNDDTVIEEVVVTGSRIQRRDYQAESPIVTADRDFLDNSSTAAIENSLNKLPGFTPVQTPSLGSDTQVTATSTPGAATVSLRNLGTNRNLVLIDGRRATPANALGVVDINTIPAAAIERVEIITGGASATYGADAVGGVVNFILKDDFEGMQVDLRQGVTEHGGGKEVSLSALMGTNFDNDRGNITIGIARTDRNRADSIDRDWFVDAWEDPRFAATEFFPDFSAFQPYGPVNPTQDAMDSIFTNGQVAAGTRIYFNTDGTAFTGFRRSINDGAYRFNGDLSGPKWVQTVDGALKQNFIEELAVLPLERDNFYLNGNYEITDSLSAFMRADYTSVKTTTMQQPSPSVNGWAALVPADGRNLPTELQTILDSREIPADINAAEFQDFYVDELNCDPNSTPGAAGSGATCDWQLTYYLNQANRQADTEVNTYNMVYGVEGEIAATDWTWELYGSRGESSTSSLVTGTASLERFRALIAAPDWGAGFTQQGNPLFGGFGAASASCTSGMDPFNKDNVSQDCLDAIAANLKTRATMTQEVWEINAQGGLFPLPAGDVRAAIGASKRINDYTFINDTLTSQGSSFQDQAIGIYPSGDSSGDIRVEEFYAELLIPVASELPLIDDLDLNLGGRYSDYNTTGETFTWKAMLDWQVDSHLRVRGGYNKAIRTPNIAELYLAPAQSFTAAGGGDVCRVTNALDYSANPSVNANAANVRAVCEILMDRQLAGSSDVFYSDEDYYLAQGPAFAFPTLIGNPDVQEEEAETWTLGFVIDSPIETGWLSQLRATIDYYRIEVDNAIGPQTLDTVQLQCFDPSYNPLIANNPSAAAAQDACQQIGRTAGDGALGNVEVTYLNSGRFETEGVDLQLDWSFDVGPGTFQFNSLVNYLIALKSAALPTAPLVDYAGTLGPSGSNAIAENGLNPGAFEWKMLNTFSYLFGSGGISLQWQHLPSVKSITYPQDPETTFKGAPSYDLFNLSMNWGFGESVFLRLGIDNLMDEEPPLTEYNTATSGLANSVGGSPLNAYFYDLVGRRYYAGLSVRF